MKFKISDLFHLDRVDEAPNSAGLYVWYGKLSVGAADWDERETKSNLIAQNQLLDAMREHTLKYRQQPLRLEASANFSTQWSGGLEPTVPGSWNDEYDGVWGGMEDHSIARGTSSNPAREVLLSLLHNALPVFSSPLYIGLAIEQSLRSRLHQHRNKLRRHWDGVTKDPDYPARIKPENFADRAIKLGFSPRDLYFYTLHIETETEINETTNLRQEELLRSAEWLLNRWANPILGRT
jgi:hypothetical protein